MDMRQLEREYSSLYCAVQPIGNPLPIHYHPVPIPDGVPSDEEILEAVKKLKSGRAPGSSGLRVDQIKEWALEQETAPRPWNDFLGLVKHCFNTRELPTSTCFSTLVLIPKAGGRVRGIGLLESVWKVISMIIKERMAANISFDNMLHGFRAGRGTGTAILKARLHLDHGIQQGRTLSQVFLNLGLTQNTRVTSGIWIRTQSFGPSTTSFLG
jgi:hypothetical protein